MEKPVLVIMAAGMGSRYGGLKQIDPVDEQGNIIIDFSIYDAVKAGFEKIVFVIKHQIEEEFKRSIGERIAKYVQVEYVFQELDKLPEGFSIPEGRVKPFGTGHAILCAKNAISGPFAVINADDFYGRHAFEEIYRQLTTIEENGQFLRAATNAGVAFGNAGCGPVHALSFAIGGKYHVPHGESCYQYFLPVLRFYKENSEGGKLARLEALLCDILRAEDGLTALAVLLERILPRKPMSAYGAVEADLEAFAVSTIENQQRLLARAYVPVTLEVARAIEQECL